MIVLQYPNRSSDLISVQPKWRTSQEMCRPSGTVYRTLLTPMTAVVMNTNCLINSVHQETRYICTCIYIFKNVYITPYSSNNMHNPSLHSFIMGLRKLVFCMLSCVLLRIHTCKYCTEFGTVISTSFNIPMKIILR